MSSSIIGIPTTRVSNLYVRDQLLNQIQANQTDLLRLEMELSTGKSFASPSEDPVAAQPHDEFAIALGAGESNQEQPRYESIVFERHRHGTFERLRLAVANPQPRLGAIGDTATDAQRQSAAQQVDQTVQQLLNAANQQYNGRYLFAGSKTATKPFSVLSNGDVEYNGNETPLSSYSDLNLLFDSNVNGNTAFGAISSAVQGTATITPTLSFNTRLADLNQGQGISKGSIQVSDGTNTSIIDLSGTETIGDVAEMIHDHPPAGRELNVDITAQGLMVQLDPAGGGSLSISEVGGGTVANDLGIRSDSGVGTNPIYGRPLDPILRGTTSLDNIFGAYAETVVHSSGSDNDIRLQADTMGETSQSGADLNGVRVTLVDDKSINSGNEFVVYDAAAKTLDVHVRSGATRACQAIDAINAAHAAGQIPFTAAIDPIEDRSGGQGLVEAGAMQATTRDGAGEALDVQSGLTITNAGQTANVSFLNAGTVEDVLNDINGCRPRRLGRNQRRERRHRYPLPHERR